MYLELNKRLREDTDYFLMKQTIIDDAHKAVQMTQILHAFKLAIDLLKNQADKSVRSACQEAIDTLKYPGSLFNAVHHRVRRALQPKQEHQKDTILGSEKEKLLVQFIQAFAHFKNPLSKAMVIEIATAMAGRAELLTTGWLSRFVQRHGKDICFAEGKLSHRKKDLLEAWPKLFKWSKEVDNFATLWTNKPWVVFNLDESRAIPASKMKSIVSSKHSKETRYQDTLKCNLFTIVSCVSADGRTLFLLFIFKEENTKNPSVYVPTEWPTTQEKIDQYPIYLAT